MDWIIFFLVLLIVGGLVLRFVAGAMIMGPTGMIVAILAPILAVFIALFMLNTVGLYNGWPFTQLPSGGPVQTAPSPGTKAPGQAAAPVQRATACEITDRLGCLQFVSSNRGATTSSGGFFLAQGQANPVMLDNQDNSGRFYVDVHVDKNARQIEVILQSGSTKRVRTIPLPARPQPRWLVDLDAELAAP